MPQPLAKTKYGHVLSPVDPIYLDALVIFQTERRVQMKHELSGKQRRRKRSLSLLHISPDMAAVGCLRALRNHLAEEYNVWYDGRHNKFKDEYDDHRTSELLGFMEAASAIFSRRNVEMDMILHTHINKCEKVYHAIRDKGQFIPSAYELGRESAYRVVILSLPNRRFTLLDDAEVAEIAPAA